MTTHDSRHGEALVEKALEIKPITLKYVEITIGHHFSANSSETKK